MTFREYYSVLLVRYPPEESMKEEKKVKQYTRNFFSDEEEAIIKRMVDRSGEHRRPQH